MQSTNYKKFYGSKYTLPLHKAILQVRSATSNEISKEKEAAN